jgi:zinc/manganese transport system permease protein
VTASVQIVGIYLVFASLIIPALATTGIRRGNRLIAGYAIGFISYVIGIMASVLLDLPTGAVIVWSMAVVALLGGFIISDKRAVD